MAGKRRLLVLGVGGQVGSYLPAALAPLGEVVALDRAGADLTNPARLSAVIREHRPDAIVNAAAYTAVDRAESEPDVAATVNAVAPGLLAEVATSLDACLVHYSTDYVFDGRQSSPYLETDPPNPLSQYGLSKLAGEQAISRACPRHLIFRTSWVISHRGTNFVKTILRLARERDHLRVVSDQRGAPTAAALVAEVTATALGTMLGCAPTDPRWGLYHLAAAGETSWHLLARHIVARAAAQGSVLKARVESVQPIATSEYPTEARRPLNSLLDTTKLRGAFQVSLPGWQLGVDRAVDQLLCRQEQ